MSTFEYSNLRFNFGFLLEALPGTSREIELNYPLVKLGGDVVLFPLTGTFKASRTTQGIYFSGELHSHISAECARCLITFDLPITIPLDDLFFYPPHEAPEGEYVVKKDGQVDLAPLVREMALLSIPIQQICREDCQGFCVECGQNLNEFDCGCQDDTIDPRLAGLKDFLDKLAP
ncbi:MAG: DUF177 domain-containing protein [Anaerolineae bacterium]|nr:DUF177 domain-containing protein [Anaerolineae bacterium]MCO5189325.1 DUF177 domain-containing protein [Anaerolineae bacterium]MCO5193893.1 DUF177 domain-containing protein [Anaerolineae bacterium]MCO5196220.1 DUF177 domain-containing protein [Anaerolineae bacterium]MCO5204490.1 DUF177 domain-containing protein [Anaerolineae bacterium]